MLVMCSVILIMLAVDPAPPAMADCSAIAQSVYRSGLIPLVDPADGRVVGLRRELYRQMVPSVGPVKIGSRVRALQFGELDAAIGELVFCGLVEDASEAGLLDVRVVPAEVCSADCAE